MELKYHLAHETLCLSQSKRVQMRHLGHFDAAGDFLTPAAVICVAG